MRSLSVGESAARRIVSGTCKIGEASVKCQEPHFFSEKGGTDYRCPHDSFTVKCQVRFTNLGKFHNRILGLSWTFVFSAPKEAHEATALALLWLHRVSTRRRPLEHIRKNQWVIADFPSIYFLSKKRESYWGCALGARCCWRTPAAVLYAVHKLGNSTAVAESAQQK